jgi:hypothetical protein
VMRVSMLPLPLLIVLFLFYLCHDEGLGAAHARVCVPVSPCRIVYCLKNGLKD